MIIAVNARLFIKGKMEGVARYIYENTRRMVLSHPEHQFVFFFDRDYDESFLFAENVIPVVVKPQARHPLLWHIWWQWQIPRLLRKYKVNVFYTGEIFMPRNTSVPRAIVSHDLAYAHYPKQIPYAVRTYYSTTYPKNHRQADAVIAVSEFTKQDIVKHFGIPADKIEVIHNSVPDGFVPMDDLVKKQIREKHTGGRPYFAYLGSFHPRKNIVNLILGYNHFREKSGQDIPLVLMGRWGWNTEEIKKTLQESPFKKDIILMEDVGEEKYKIVASAIALCYVSLFEGFGIPILEGFSAGVPVITSNVSSMPEVAGDAAYQIDPKQPEEISQAMIDLSKDQVLRDELIEKGSQRLSMFNWDKSAEKTFEILERIATR